MPDIHNVTAHCHEPGSRQIKDLIRCSPSESTVYPTMHVRFRLEKSLDRCIRQAELVEADHIDVQPRAGVYLKQQQDGLLAW